MSVPWRGRETGNVRYLLPAAALRGRERLTAWTALFTNLMKSMRQPGAEREGTHGPRLVNARRVRGDGEVCALFDAGSRQWLNVEQSKKSVGMS